MVDRVVSLLPNLKSQIHTRHRLPGRLQQNHLLPDPQTSSLHSAPLSTLTNKMHLRSYLALLRTQLILSISRPPHLRNLKTLSNRTLYQGISPQGPITVPLPAIPTVLAVIPISSERYLRCKPFRPFRHNPSLHPLGVQVRHQLSGETNFSSNYIPSFSYFNRYHLSFGFLVSCCYL